MTHVCPEADNWRGLGGRVRSLLISPLKLETGTNEDIARISTQGAGGEGTNAVSLPQPNLALEDFFLHSSAGCVVPEWVLQLSLSLPRLSKCFLLSFLLFC